MIINDAHIINDVYDNEISRDTGCKMIPDSNPTGPDRGADDDSSVDS